MADDEQTKKHYKCSRVKRYHVLLLLLFQLTSEINSFIETNYDDHNFIHITNKLSCVSRLSRSSRRACRASRDERVALVATCCVALAVQHARHSTYDVFLDYRYPVVTCRDVMQQVEFWLYPLTYLFTYLHSCIEMTMTMMVVARHNVRVQVKLC